MHDQLRAMPLQVVIGMLGVPTEFKPRKGGTEWSGKCPVHQPKSNQSSFSFDATGRFNCFSCGAKGRGAIDLAMQIRKVGFKEAVELLTTHRPTDQPAHPEVKVERVEVTENPPFKGSYDKFAVPSDWLKNRGFSEATLKRYEVFQYDNPKRRSAYSGSVMLKIRRYSDGESVGYLSRNIGEVTAEKPKYRFPKDFHKGLEVFGAWQIKNDANAPQVLPLRVGYLVESPFCCMKFHQLGLPAVSPYGWSVSDQQISILKQLARGWIFLPDRNKHAEALQFASRLCVETWVKAPELPSGVDDPEKLTAEQVRQLT